MLYIVLTVQVILGFLIIGVSATCMVAIMIFVEEQRENWRERKHRQRLEEDYEKLLQYRRRRELRRKEQEKYPLFFWRELTAKNLDVIEEKLEDE